MNSGACGGRVLIRCYKVGTRMLSEKNEYSARWHFSKKKLKIFSGTKRFIHMNLSRAVRKSLELHTSECLTPLGSARNNKSWKLPFHSFCDFKANQMLKRRQRLCRGFVYDLLNCLANDWQPPSTGFMNLQTTLLNSSTRRLFWRHSSAHLVFDENPRWSCDRVQSRNFSTRFSVPGISASYYRRARTVQWRLCFRVRSLSAIMSEWLAKLEPQRPRFVMHLNRNWILSRVEWDSSLFINCSTFKLHIRVETKEIDEPTSRFTSLTFTFDFHNNCLDVLLDFGEARESTRDIQTSQQWNQFEA